MDFEIRNLKAPDLFIVTTIASKLGIREIKNCFKGDDLKNLMEGKNVAEIGMKVAFDVAGVVLENMQKCEKELYQVLANVTNKKPKEIQELDAPEFLDLIIQVIMNPKNKDFFKLASRFLNTKN